MLSNLEVVTHRENGNKKHLVSTSTYVGVRLVNRKWESKIWFNKKRLQLGTFDTEIEASKYYEAALICINEGRIKDIVIKRKGQVVAVPIEFFKI
jgi:hypothetical protein